MQMALDCELVSSPGDLLLPGLVQQVFNKYQRQKGISITKTERAELFTELSALLSEELLERTLRLLDEWSIIIYYTPDRLRSIVEFDSKRNLAQVVRIIPGVNYCKCRYFQRCVLQLPKSEGDEKLELDDNYNQVSFTCDHMLAQRLHQLLNPKPREQVLTLSQFRYFQDDIYAD
ncbi:uncharacterized protein LOC116805757 [Drosophila grimshawi]|uniref:uncharacterized protein LOC116805757 n=1 Tax=Drosophila grimshawi TaxID=7222 RepID=UPI0013EF2BB6|nr:uncharacterized protein LOC116805757 [Drosophila grimshawi]